LKDIRTMSVLVGAVMQQPKDIQTALHGMEIDLVRVMRSNHLRTYPGASPAANEYGRMTVQGAKSQPWYEQIDASMSVGIFFMEWDITLWFPLATG
jgi:hypothetical protein